MMEPFTEEEKVCYHPSWCLGIANIVFLKRLLLAEIIKNSQLDVKILGRFIKSNRIDPNWMRMQLPAGMHIYLPSYLYTNLLSRPPHG